MIIKCKMCGGDIEFLPGNTYGTCEYCGSTSTIPTADDESKLNRYNRANHFRRQCEFDKAVSAYEKILEQDDTDAEAHWGACISRYGIEYVEDPVTKKRIPTCHRVQLTSILADKDYKAAMEYAPDNESRKIYEEEASKIAEIQKGILAISQNEKPYDVFICYKETDENGQRTHDSQWAQEVYYGLTEQGYKVFFSRITLEDKLGQEYEPYIFAALNSARVMVVIGSKPEYFNAVWVKNEWSRYLALMEKDRKRLLIPCYRGMDPYDLPDELSSLQSQDMGKIGFMQDLIRGVKKVLDAENSSVNQKSAAQTILPETDPGLTPGISSLMERASLFMEDGDFESAAEYLDRVLDINPKYAPAYAAKTCVAFKYRKESDLAGATFLYDDNLDWQKAIRFANPQQKAVYEGYLTKAKENVAIQIRNYVYDCAIEMAVVPGLDKGKINTQIADYKFACEHSAGNRADGSRRNYHETEEKNFVNAVKNNDPGDIAESGFKSAAELFESIGDDKAIERAQQCMVLAEQARQKAIYRKASTIFDTQQHRARPDIEEIRAAAKLFLSVSDYKDARTQVQACEDFVESICSQLYEKAIKEINEAGDESRRWAYVKDVLKVSELTGYRDVDQLRIDADKRYDECVTAEMEAKRQAEMRIQQKLKATAAWKKKIRIIRIIIISAIIFAIGAIILVTQVIIPSIQYRKAVALQQSGRYEEAITAFEAMGGYSDSRAQIEICRNSIIDREYQSAVALKQEGRYEEAIIAFESLNGYSDSYEQIESCQNGINETKYMAGIALKEAGQYEDAIKVFQEIPDYRDSGMQNYYCRISIAERDYQTAIDLQKTGKYEDAIALFKELQGFNDSTAQITETKYLQAKSLTAAGDYAGAVAIFDGMKDYKDVSSLLSKDQNLTKAAAQLWDAKCIVGNYVMFGHYPQTSEGNDNSSIEWLVLERTEEKALLISRYGLDAKPYHENPIYVTWENCTLRGWLNSTFLDRAFTVDEQKGILLTNVENGTGEGYWVLSGGRNTQDKVFLLSWAEANKYWNVTFNNDKNMNSRITATPFARQRGAEAFNSFKTSDGSEASWWWLRSPGNDYNVASNVLRDGSLNHYDVSNAAGCVRPALWIDLKTDNF